MSKNSVAVDRQKKYNTSMKTCTIIVKDQVNIKIEGLELDTRRRLTKQFKYEVPYARYLPAVRLGRWDGKIAYFQMGGSTFLNLLPDIVPILEQENYVIDVQDLRHNNHRFEFNACTGDSFSHIKWPSGHPMVGEPIVLRDYQIEIINNFLNNTQSLQEVATGSGKTIMTAALSYCVEQYGRTIIIVPNKSLVGQTEKDYRNLGLDVGVYYGDRKEFNHRHTICTWQSLNVLLKNTKNNEADITINEFLDNVVAVIVDECHQVKADALKTLLTGVMADIPIRWGLTGTVPKDLFESQALYVSIGPVINQLKAAELQSDGVLAQCHVNIIQMIDHREFKDYQSELKYLLEDDDRLTAMASLIERINQNGNTLVLVDRVQAGKNLVAKLGQRAVFVSGSTKSKDRQAQYDEVADSNDKIIVATYGVAAVGINIVRLHHVVLIEPGKSFVRVIQSIGRGLRKGLDKDFVNIWDITSTCRFSKKHLTKRKQFYTEAQYKFSLEKLQWQ
jgi:superfamily II DNA or RNA helicase